jgi:hypothetical protein
MRSFEAVGQSQIGPRNSMRSHPRVGTNLRQLTEEFRCRFGSKESPMDASPPEEIASDREQALAIGASIFLRLFFC